MADAKIEIKPAQPDTTKPSLPAEKTPDAPAAALPQKVRIAQLYGYYDDNRRYREWHEGDVVSDAAEVALLIERQAPLIDVATGVLVPYEKDQPKPRAA